jgi:hypothetical protein
MKGQLAAMEKIQKLRQGGKIPGESGVEGALRYRMV